MVLLIAAVFCQIVSALSSDVYLGPGQLHRIHPEARKPTKDEFVIKSSPGSNVQISCEDFRLPSRPGDDPCTLAMVKFNDRKEEKKYCETKYDIRVKSAGNQVSIVLDLPHGAYIDCYARSTQEPEDVKTVELKVEDGSFLIDLKNDKQKPYADIVYKFSSINRLSARCTKSLPEPCQMSALYINDGEVTKELCGSDDVEIVSKGNRMTVRVTADQYGEADVRCLIQSITGPHANQIKNMVSEEVDSREHGVTKGRTSTTCNCGWVNKGTDRRVLNGKTTKEGEYPYMVILVKEGRGFSCGGSIITAKHVLTAAHCVLNSKVRKLSTYVPTAVIVGGYDLTKESSHGHSQKINVKEYFIRQEWLDFSQNYDISILLLESEIQFSQFVGPVCLPNPEKPYKLYYKRIKLTGWGLNEEYRTPEKLQTTRLFVLDSNVCPVESGIMCVYSRTSSSCFGDSGGPLVHLDPDTNRYTQVSIVSYGAKSDCVGFSGTSNVTYHYPWIKDIIDRTSTKKLCMKV